MAMNWSQGGQYYGQGPPGPPRNQGFDGGRHTGPPPICFNCGIQGHYVADCPAPRKQLPGGLIASRVNNQAANAQWSNNQGGTLVNQHQQPTSAPAVNNYGPQYQPPSQTHYGAPQPAYSPQASYQQYPMPGGPPQTYPTHGGAQQAYSQIGMNQQYQAPAPYNSAPPPQAYAQRGQYGVQAPQAAYNAYSQHHSQQAQQVPAPAWQRPQQYGQHQQPPSQQSHYAAGNNSYGAPQAYQGGYQQWTGAPSTPVSQGPPRYQPMQQHQAGQGSMQQQYMTHQQPLHQQQHMPQPPQQQQPMQAQHMHQRPMQQLSEHHMHPQSIQQQIKDIHRRQASATPRPRSTSYQPQLDHQVSGTYQPTQQSQGFQQQNEVRQASVANQSSPAGSYMPPPSAASESNSAVSTPYGRRGSHASSAHRGRGGSVTPRQKDKPKKEKKQDKERSTEEDQFNWDFKYIFKDEESQETVALAQPLSTTFNSTPVPLMDPKPKNTVSRYARKDNLKEYISSIRKSLQWPYLSQDPIFKDLHEEGILVPLRDVQTWMEARHGSDAVPLEHRRASGTRRKRSRAETEQHDVDGQVQSELSPYNKRQRVDEPQHDEEMASFTKEGTPVFERSGTPYLGSVDDDAWLPQPGDALASDPTEALLASLGVTGAPKPVKPRKADGFPVSTNGQSAPRRVSQDGSHNTYDNPPKRKDSGYPNGGTKNGVKSTNGNGGGNGVRNDTRSTSHDHPPPPPPPPFAPSGYKKDQDSGSETKEDSSPLSPTSREILGQLGAPAEPPKPRKIIRVISGRKNTEPMRQEDDVTPRYRRSQPRVEEAYSRRW